MAGLTADATALGELFQADGVTQAHIHVLDTAANITTALDSPGGSSQINGIIVSDSGSNEVVATAAQLTTDAAALAELFQANGTTPAHVKVSDTAAHISSNFNALNGNAQVDLDRHLRQRRFSAEREPRSRATPTRWPRPSTRPACRS